MGEAKFTSPKQESKEESKEESTATTERYSLIQYPVQYAIGIQDNKSGKILSDQELIVTLLNKFNKQVAEI